MDNVLDVLYIEDSENDVDLSFYIEIEEGPSEEVREATEFGTKCFRLRSEPSIRSPSALYPPIKRIHFA